LFCDLEVKNPEQLSEESHSQEPMLGNAKRQATGLFKGIDFQIWLTVDAWITIEEEQCQRAVKTSQGGADENQPL